MYFNISRKEDATDHYPQLNTQNKAVSVRAYIIMVCVVLGRLFCKTIKMRRTVYVYFVFVAYLFLRNSALKRKKIESKTFFM